MKNNFIVSVDSDDTNSKRYKLLRKNDGETVWADHIHWIEWTENGIVRTHYDEAKIGRSLICDHIGFGVYSWLTTPVTEIISQTDKRIVFKTLNSTYLLVDKSVK